jgi:hypothetical protein
MAAFRFLVPTTPFLCMLMAWYVFRAADALTCRVTERRDLSDARTSMLSRVARVATLAAMIALSVVNLASERLKNPFSDHDNTSLQAGIGDLVAGGWDLASVNRSALMLNTYHRRDLEAITPFVENDLRRLALDAADGRIVYMSYQMGIVPYVIRHSAPDLDVYFVDTVGLCDRTIARLPLPRRHVGIAPGLNLLGTLTGKAGPLSDYVLATKPNLVYYPRAVVGADADFARLQFVRAYTHPGATFFFKPAR